MEIQDGLQSVVTFIHLITILFFCYAFHSVQINNNVRKNQKDALPTISTTKLNILHVTRMQHLEVVQDYLHETFIFNVKA